MNFLRTILLVVKDYFEVWANGRELPDPIIFHPAQLPVIPDISPTELLVQEATKWLGKDVTPDDKVSDEVACVASLVQIIPPQFALNKALTYTPDLFTELKANKRFKAILKPMAGCIIVSPTQGSVKGHCGIFLTDSRIASNTSKTGLWQDNYSLTSWVQSFKRVKGLHVYIFEPI